MHNLRLPMLDLPHASVILSPRSIIAEDHPTHIQRKRIALQKQPQVSILPQHRVIRDLLDALLQPEAPLLDELVVEAAEGVLAGDGRDDDAGVVERERLVEPEEVGVAAEDGEGGFAEFFGGGLGGGGEWVSPLCYGRRDTRTCVCTVYMMYGRMGSPTF